MDKLMKLIVDTKEAYEYYTGKPPTTITINMSLIPRLRDYTPFPNEQGYPEQFMGMRVVKTNIGEQFFHLS